MTADLLQSSPSMKLDLARAEKAQQSWVRSSMKDRLRHLRRLRHSLASSIDDLLEDFPRELSRTPADSLASEVLPLLAACRFLERSTQRVLRTRSLGAAGRPFWLSGVHSRVLRVPFGRILVIGPSNYPLFLPGVQVLQALAAGNSVIWKPGRGGLPVAQVFARCAAQAGLPEGLLQVTHESVQAASDALRAGVDKVFFTGSSAAGRAVLRQAAESATPVVAELSGCDAVYVLPGADHERVAQAIAFGMRLNGSSTCMAPRRLVLIGAGHEPLLERLRQDFDALPATSLATAVRERLVDLVEDAAASGAMVLGDLRGTALKPVLLLGVRPAMRIAQADIFAPVLSVLQVPDAASALAADLACPYGLTASIFGDEATAEALGAQLVVGTVLINDLIVPTADPRVPFGGRRGSGFGVTRGAEGLLAMTAAKTVLVRRGHDLKHYQATGAPHEQLFRGVAALTHAGSWRSRLAGLRAISNAVRLMR